MKEFLSIASHFIEEALIAEIAPMGNGLINDTYRVRTHGEQTPDYVLQRINNSIFTDVALLQHNIEAVTRHIRQKLVARGEQDIDRKVLRFLPVRGGEETFFQTDDGKYWRMSVLIPRSHTVERVDAETSGFAGVAFGEFESMLTDLPEQLGETIPDFHNMELRSRQLREAVTQDAAGRMAEVADFVSEVERHSEAMCQAEQLHREGKLPKRVCHCDTKVNNMLFDEDGSVLCVIDLDTVMPSFVFSDFGDFLRTAANTVAEDDPNIDQVDFRMDIYEAFREGYLHSAEGFLTPLERELLPYAAALFPYMQCVRFLADYINGDTYYKTKYPEHNLVRAKNQWRLFEQACKRLQLDL